MREISDHMLDFVKGGMNLNGLPGSTNVIDLRGKDMGTYIDANGACWAPGTPSIIMYPGEVDLLIVWVVPHPVQTAAVK